MEISVNHLLFPIGFIFAVIVLLSLYGTFVAKPRFMRNTDVFRLFHKNGIWYIWHNLRGYYDIKTVLNIIRQGGLITREQESDFLNQSRQGTLNKICIPGGRYTDVKNITIDFFKDHLGSIAVELNEDEMTHEEAFNHYKVKISSVLGEGDDLGSGSSCNWRNVVLAQGNDITNSTMVILYLPSDKELIELGKEATEEESMNS